MHPVEPGLKANKVACRIWEVERNETTSKGTQLNVEDDPRLERLLSQAKNFSAYTNFVDLVTHTYNNLVDCRVRKFKYVGNSFFVPSLYLAECIWRQQYCQTH